MPEEEFFVSTGNDDYNNVNLSDEIFEHLQLD